MRITNLLLNSKQQIDLSAKKFHTRVSINYWQIAEWKVFSQWREKKEAKTNYLERNSFGENYFEWSIVVPQITFWERKTKGWKIMEEIRKNVLENSNLWSNLHFQRSERFADAIWRKLQQNPFSLSLSFFPLHLRIFSAFSRRKSERKQFSKIDVINFCNLLSSVIV